MTQQTMGQAPAAVRIKFGDGPTQDLSLDLAEAVLREVWKSSPERFGNHVKKAMMRLWPASSQNGAGRG